MKPKGRSWSSVAVWFSAFLVVWGCARRPPSELVLPPPPRTSFQVEGAGPLTVELVQIEKRPLTAQELIPGTARGMRWEYTLRFKGTSRGVTISRLTMNLIGHLGEVRSEERPFSFHMDPGDEADVTFEAVLSTSMKDRPEPLMGVHQLLLEGKDDRGEALRISIRVPLA